MKVADHAHRWRLEEPNGKPLVVATCQICGAIQEMFAAWGPDRDPKIAQAIHNNKDLPAR